MKYPQYYLPLADVDASVLRPTGQQQRVRHGPVEVVDLVSAGGVRPGVARRLVSAADPELADHVRFDWDGLDAWFEEDEQVFVQPRNPYTRADALRSSSVVEVRLSGVLLASSSATVMVFETGLSSRRWSSCPRPGCSSTVCRAGWR